MTGDKIILTIFQIFLSAIIIFTLYTKNEKLAYFLLILLLLLMIWKQYTITIHPSICSLVKKMHCYN